MLVADLSYGIEKAQERLSYWLTFLTMATGSTPTTPIHVMLVASHTDAVRAATRNEIPSLVQGLRVRFFGQGVRLHPQVFCPQYNRPGGGPDLQALVKRLDQLAADDRYAVPFPQQ